MNEQRDWAAYFRGRRAALEAERPKEIVVEPLEVVEVVESPDESMLGRSPAALLQKVRAVGWETRVLRTRVHHPDEVYLSDSEEHSRGELKKAAHDTVHWSISAWWPRARVAFRSMWTETAITKTATEGPRRPLKSKIAKRLLELEAEGEPILVEGPEWRYEKTTLAFGFDGFVVQCPIGVPRELYVDYSPKGYMTKREADEPDRFWQQRVDRLEAAGRRQDATYNDGADYIEHRAAFDQAGPFNEWLEDWLTIAARAAQREEQAA